MGDKDASSSQMIKVRCPNPECRKVLAVKADLAGRKGRCPLCKQAMSIPKLPGASPTVEVARPAPGPSGGNTISLTAPPENDPGPVEPDAEGEPAAAPESAVERPAAAEQEDAVPSSFEPSAPLPPVVPVSPPPRHEAPKTVPMPVAAAPQSPSAAPPVPPPPRRKPDSNDPWASEELIKNTERKPPRIVLPQSGLAALPGRLRGEAAKAKPPEPSAPRPTLRATPVPRLPNLPPPSAVALLSGVLPTSTEKASASSIAREIAEERRRSLTAADRAAEPPQRSEAAQVDAKPAEPPPAQPVPPPPMRPAGDEAETPEPPASAQQQPESAQRSFRDELEQSRVVEHDAAPEPNDEQGLRPHRRGSHPTTGRLRQRPAKEEISFELSGGVLVVSGAIGYDLDRRFNEACQRMVASPETRLVLDLSKVSYLSSTYLGVIAPLYAATTKAGKTLVLRAQAKVARVLRLSGFDRLGEVEVVEDPR